MAEEFRVRLTKDYLVFSAGHFITFGGNICERLHGHNYRVDAEVRDDLDENHYVIDFIALRDALHKIVLELDHYMLLPAKHPTIRVTADEKELLVTFEERRWIFPKSDCVLLPVENTTSELLAKYIGQRLKSDMKIDPAYLRISVDENNNQWGDWVLRRE